MFLVEAPLTIYSLSTSNYCIAKKIPLKSNLRGISACLLNSINSSERIIFIEHNPRYEFLES